MSASISGEGASSSEARDASTRIRRCLRRLAALVMAVSCLLGLAGAQQPSAPAASPEPATASDREPQDSGSVVAPKTPGESLRLQIENDVLRVQLTNRGARALAVRLLQFQLHVGEPQREPSDADRGLQIAYHSRAPVSAFSIFAPASPYAEPSHPLRSIVARLETSDWAMEPVAPEGAWGQGVRWSLDAGPLTFVKTFRLPAQGYLAELALEVSVRDEVLETSQDATSSLQLLLLPGAWVFSDHDPFFQSPSAWAGTGAMDSPSTESRGPSSLAPSLDPSAPVGGDLTDRTPIVFAADSNKYFVAGMVPKDSFSADAIRAVKTFGIQADVVKGKEPRIASAMLLVSRLPRFGQPLQFRFHSYFGPKRPDLLAEVPALDSIARADRSSFRLLVWISDLLIAILELFHWVTGNWGVAIIFLTLLVRGSLFPLTRKSQLAMGEFARRQTQIKPQLDALTERWKGNSKKLNEERIKLYREKKVPMAPPLLGCLPIFIQIPIFFGLFAALRTTYQLRQQPFFLWIRDLSQPDQLFQFDWSFTLPLVGTIQGLNVLPILMVILWVAHQRLMPKPTDPQQAQIQKMMIFMPFVFGLTLYNYAAGLSLYMITSSSLGIIEQTVIKKFWPVPTAGAMSMPAM